MTISGRIGATQLTRMLGDWRRVATRPDAASHRPAGYATLAAAVRGLLRDGRLGLRVRLPAERLLAAELGASRTTVSAAYRLLREQGYLDSRRGSGSVTRLPEGHRMSTTGLWVADGSDGIDLGCASLPAPPELFGAAERALRALPDVAAGPGYHPDGLPALRAAIAGWFTRRGAPTEPAEILVTAGAMHAFALVTRLLLAPGERVLVESPSYPNALSALGYSDARVDRLPVGAHGWDVEPVLPALAAGRYRLAYLIPDFHNPTGQCMPEPVRRELLRAARTGGTTLVVDETFVDLPHPGTPVPPPTAAADRHRRVLTIGGMSKPYWAGLRIGWLRAAPAMVQRLSAARAALDMGGAVLDQLTAVELLRTADTVLPVRRAALAAARDALTGALREYLPDWRFSVPRGGMSLWVELDAPVSSALCQAAGARGVRLAPGPRFGAEGTLERFVRIPFTRPAGDLVEAVRRIAAARADLDAAPARRATESSIVA